MRSGASSSAGGCGASSVAVRGAGSPAGRASVRTTRTLLTGGGAMGRAGAEGATALRGSGAARGSSTGAGGASATWRTSGADGKGACGTRGAGAEPPGGRTFGAGVGVAAAGRAAGAIGVGRWGAAAGSGAGGRSGGSAVGAASADGSMVAGSGVGSLTGLPLRAVTMTVGVGLDATRRKVNVSPAAASTLFAGRTTCASGRRTTTWPLSLVATVAVTGWPPNRAVSAPDRVTAGGAGCGGALCGGCGVGWPPAPWC